ncbi:MAG: tRNA preQ1(34) S-adenosylmethionine ribosyltransferase-isomerase QueA [Verrucomicrobiota bacterium]
MKTDDFDYALPEELIASRPLERREDSRMMLVDRGTGAVSHHCFGEFSSMMGADDLVVLNDTRVVRARFFSDDGKVELLRTEVFSPTTWKCMVRPGKRMKAGREVVVGGVRGTVQEVADDGERIVEFESVVDEEKHGHLALPPYFRRGDDGLDVERYQTVYAREAGAIAAPTAGLHFTPEILEEVAHEFLTLHVGVGTFLPVRVDEVEEHRMHAERYEIGEGAAERIEGADRVVAVGTTVTRVLEHCMRERGQVWAHRGETDIFIYPPYSFGRVGALLTNFHLPRSTLLMLVSALAGRELIQEAYAEAIREAYRFYSYGDCMLIV